MCELGIAVGNAVDALKAHADVVLREANGAGIRAFLEGPVLSGAMRVHPRRWEVPLGTFEGGEPATIPASQINLLVMGDSGSGKSYVAGVLAERLISLGYTVCVLDPEGEHDALGRLRGAASVGGDEPLPQPEQLRRLVLHRLGSLAVDLSSLSPELKLEYLAKAFEALRQERAATGLPHWVVVDEAQLSLETGMATRVDLAPGGFCVVTYRPERIPGDLLEQIDVLLALRDEPARVAAVLAALGPAFDARVPEPPGWGTGGLPRRVLIATRHGGPARAFIPSSRVSAHVRHPEGRETHRSLDSAASRKGAHGASGSCHRRYGPRRRSRCGGREEAAMKTEASRLIFRLLANNDVMGLATVRPDGYPQATTVAYANDGLTLYCACDRDCQKIRNLARNDYTKGFGHTELIDLRRRHARRPARARALA